MTEWVEAAFNGDETLYRLKDTDIFKIEEGESVEEFVVEDPEHAIWSRFISYQEAQEYHETRAIYHGQTKDYSEINLEEGYIITEGEKVEFEASEVSQEDKAELLSENL